MAMDKKEIILVPHHLVSTVDLDVVERARVFALQIPKRADELPSSKGKGKTKLPGSMEDSNPMSLSNISYSWIGEFVNG